MAGKTFTIGLNEVGNQLFGWIKGYVAGWFRNDSEGIEGNFGDMIRASDKYVPYEGILRKYNPNEVAVQSVNGVKSINLEANAATNLDETSDSGTYINPPGSEILTESPTGDNTAVRPVPDSTADRYQTVLSGGTYTTGQKLVYSWYRERFSTPVNDSFIGDLDVSSLINMIKLSQTQIESNINGFDRFQAVLEITDGSLDSTFRGYFGNVIGVGNSSVAYWGHQYEEGENASTLVRTNGSTATREADQLINFGNSNIFNSEEGVLDIGLNYVGDSSEVLYLGLSDNTGSNYIELRVNRSTNLVQYRAFSAGAGTANISTTSILVSDIDSIKMKWKLNDFGLKINDTEITGGVTTGNPPVGLTRFSFASANNSIQGMNGIVNYIEISPDTSNY